jgi:hypothetical protein
MYAKVPGHLREPLLKELRQLRLWSIIKYYPAVVLIFSAITALVVFIIGHALLRLIRDVIPSQQSDARLIAIALSAILLITAGVLAYFLRMEYKECDCQECLYCPECDAVDKYDSGKCPICQTSLVEKESFYYTTYKDEQKVIERWGLQASREG